MIARKRDFLWGKRYKKIKCEAVRMIKWWEMGGNCDHNRNQFAKCVFLWFLSVCILLLLLLVVVCARARVCVYAVRVRAGANVCDKFVCVCMSWLVCAITTL